jgi:methyl-accepting chemotaxis protein
VAEIQRNIVKHGKRGVVSRHVHAKNDKEKIAAWGSDLVRILQVFNVCSVVSVWLLLTQYSQTELAINTHVTVSNTHSIISELGQNVTSTHAIVSELGQNITGMHTMVSDIHRTMVKIQEDSGGINPLVSETRTLPITE